MVLSECGVVVTFPFTSGIARVLSSALVVKMVVLLSSIVRVPLIVIVLLIVILNPQRSIVTFVFSSEVME